MFQYPLSVRCFVSLAYGKGLISTVTLSVLVPQSIGSFIHKRIGDHTRDVPCFPLGVLPAFNVPCFSLGFGGTMCLIFLTYSLFLLVSVLHFIVCSSMDTPVYWFDLWPAFYHLLLCIRRFLAKIRVHTRIFGQKSRTNAAVL